MRTLLVFPGRQVPRPGRRTLGAATPSTAWTRRPGCFQIGQPFAASTLRQPNTNARFNGRFSDPQPVGARARFSCSCSILVLVLVPRARARFARGVDHELDHELDHDHDHELELECRASHPTGPIGSEVEVDPRVEVRPAGEDLAAAVGAGQPDHGDAVVLRPVACIALGANVREAPLASRAP